MALRGSSSSVASHADGVDCGVPITFFLLDSDPTVEEDPLTLTCGQETELETEPGLELSALFRHIMHLCIICVMARPNSSMLVPSMTMQSDKVFGAVGMLGFRVQSWGLNLCWTQKKGLPAKDTESHTAPMHTWTDKTTRAKVVTDRRLLSCT